MIFSFHDVELALHFLRSFYRNAASPTSVAVVSPSFDTASWLVEATSPAPKKDGDSTIAFNGIVMLCAIKADVFCDHDFKVVVFVNAEGFSRDLFKRMVSTHFSNNPDMIPESEE